MANFTPTGVEFKSAKGTIFGIGWKHNQMYKMQVTTKISGQGHDFAAVAKGQTLDKWH